MLGSRHVPPHVRGRSAWEAGVELKVVVGLIGALALGASSAAAQGATHEAKPAACAQIDVNLPPDLAVWGVRTDMASVSRPADLKKNLLPPNETVNAALHPVAQISYVAPPGKPVAAGSSGGMFAVQIETAATYRVVLSAAAWLDVVKDGQPVASTAHSPGPPCSTAHKMVDFPLQPGLYVIQVSGSADPTIGLLVLQRP